MRTKSSLKRFGVAIDGPLLTEIDALAAERQCTRSELFRDMARAEVGRANVARGVEAVAALTIVYDHHVRDLSDRLTDIQHEFGEGVRAALHVHLSHDYCLEVIVLRGRSDALQAVANRISGMRGVKHGGIEIVSDIWQDGPSGHVHHGHPLRTPSELPSVNANESGRTSAAAPRPGAPHAKPAKSGKAKLPSGRPRRGHTHSG